MSLWNDELQLERDQWKQRSAELESSLLLSGQQISSLQAELGKEVREKFEIDGANQRLTIELEKALGEMEKYKRFWLDSLKTWRCFHCGQIFDKESGKTHFGPKDGDQQSYCLADLQQQLAAAKLKWQTGKPPCAAKYLIKMSDATLELQDVSGSELEWCVWDKAHWIGPIPDPEGEE